MAVIKSAVITGKSFLWKTILYGTGILLVIIMLHSSILATREKSLRPFLVNLGGRIIATDNYIYTQIQNLKQNPDKIYYDAKYLKAQEQFKEDENRLQLEYKKLQTRYEKFKFYLSKTWIYLDILLSIWFLITVFYLLYKFVDFIGNFSTLGNMLIAIIIFSFLQISFTLMLYDHRVNDNKSFSELSIVQQSWQLIPIKGIISLGKDLTYYIGLAYEKVVLPVEIAKEQPGVTGTVAKTLG